MIKTATIVVVLLVTLAISFGLVLSTCSAEDLASGLHRSRNLSEDHKLIKIGMTLDEVIDVLGKPDQELPSKGGKLALIYNDLSKVPPETLLVRLTNKEVVKVLFSD